jgi:hypothetical protein
MQTVVAAGRQTEEHPSQKILAAVSEMSIEPTWNQYLETKNIEYWKFSVWKLPKVLPNLRSEL